MSIGQPGASNFAAQPIVLFTVTFAHLHYNVFECG